MRKAIVLLSGGIDSTVTLAYAISEGYEVYPLTFLYGQKHSREISSAERIVKHYGLKRHLKINLDPSLFSSSALVSRVIDLPKDRSAEKIGSDIPDTYVPSRNLVFLSIASAVGENENVDAIFIGANAIDFSGYPDCRPEFFEAFKKVLEVGTRRGVRGKPIAIETPILHMKKSEIIKLGKSLNAPLHMTWSCYSGGERACGRCDSCVLRLKGFEEAGYEDEIEYEARK